MCAGRVLDGHSNREKGRFDLNPQSGSGTSGGNQSRQGHGVKIRTVVRSLCRPKKEKEHSRREKNILLGVCKCWNLHAFAPTL